MPRFRKNDVVQFTENHKWVASFGIISEVEDRYGDFQYLIGVPIPLQGIAYIFSMESDNEFEYIGRAVLGEPEDEGVEENSVGDK